MNDSSSWMAQWGSEKNEMTASENTFADNLSARSHLYDLKSDL